MDFHVPPKKKWRAKPHISLIMEPTRSLVNADRTQPHEQRLASGNGNTETTRRVKMTNAVLLDALWVAPG